MVPREGERGKGRSTDGLGVCSAGRGGFSAGRGVRQKWNLTVGLLFPSIRFLKIVVDPSSLCCGEKQFQGVIHPAWKRYSVNPVLAVPGSLDSNGTQTLNSRFPGEGGTNPIPGGRFVLQSVMDVSEILSLTSSRARGGDVGKSVGTSGRCSGIQRDLLASGRDRAPSVHCTSLGPAWALESFGF